MPKNHKWYVHVFRTPIAIAINIFDSFFIYWIVDLARFNDTWSMLFKRNCEPLLEYGRPVYTLTNVDDIFKLVDKNQVSTIKDDDILALVFSGSRWFAIKIPSGKKLDGEVIEQQGREYHAFWDRYV